MMTDMKTIANLPVCSRRILYRAKPDGPIIVFCKPPIVQLKKLPPKEAVKNSELFKQRVITIEDCVNCKEIDGTFQLILKPNQIEPVAKKPELLKDGTIVYEKEGWEPPPAPPGYRRKSEDPKSKDAWVLVPEQPFCIYVEFEKKKAEGCGCERYSLICTREGKRILLLQKETCQECPHRI